MDNPLNMFRKKAPPVKPTQTVGVGGTAIYGGYVQTIEKNADLQGSKKYITFSQNLVNIAIVGAGVRYFLNLIAKAGWTVTPADETPAAAEAAEFMDGILYDMKSPWTRVVRRAAMYKFYGFSIQEWTAKSREDGKIGMFDISPRPQSTIERWEKEDEHGEIIGVYQRNPQTGQEIFLPRNKVVYVVDDSLSDSPEGLGIFRHIAPDAERLQRYIQLEGYGVETDLRGIPILRAPLALLQKLVDENKISEAKKNEMVQVLKDFIDNHIRAPESGLLLDSIPYRTEDEKGTPSSEKQWDVELLKGTISSLPELSKAIDRSIRMIAILLGVEHLLLGSDSKGSYALARDKTNNFFLIVDSTLRELGESFDQDLVDPIWKLNGLDPKLKPSLTPEPTKFSDVELVTGALRDLAQAGAVLDPDDPAIDEVREMVGLSRRDLAAIEEDAMVTPKDRKPDPEDMPEEEEE